MFKTEIIPPNIAFFDSGQGGLTIWEPVVKRFPRLNTQYLGDNARCPYGNKSSETILRYAAEAALFLSSRNAQLIVVACGTASSVAVQELQRIFKVPIIGIVEGFCKLVASLLVDKNRCVAVLGTRFTIKSKRFEEELGSFGIKNVWARACPLFVPLIEEGISSGEMAEAATEMYLWDAPSDLSVVMLACTHYARLARSIAMTLEKRFGRTIVYKTIDGEWVLVAGRNNVATEPIWLMDASVSIVDSVSMFLQSNSQASLSSQDSFRRVLCTDSPEQFHRVARFFSSVDLPEVQTVEIQT
ncbi:MAG: glutamate racemase [Silvanigrellaceae bacterium]|nr:glutamate racemase [Silvanigrellaceae bacterium]